MNSELKEAFNDLEDLGSYLMQIAKGYKVHVPENLNNLFVDTDEHDDLIELKDHYMDKLYLMSNEIKYIRNVVEQLGREKLSDSIQALHDELQKSVDENYMVTDFTKEDVKAIEGRLKEEQELPEFIRKPKTHMGV